MAKSINYFGIHTVVAILEQRPLDALQLFIQDGRDDDRVKVIQTLAADYGVSVQSANKIRLEKLANSTQHQGVVLQARPKPLLNERDLPDLLPTDKPALFLLLDRITDPHNLGACLRTAAAMGVTAVVCPREKSVGLTPTACKISAGGSEIISFVSVTNLARSIAQLKELGVHVVGTMLDDTAKPMHDVELTEHCAVVMGAEDTGLRRLTKESCDQLVYLPMYGDIQSLNVSVATGMALYEVQRQRNV